MRKTGLGHHYVPLNPALCFLRVFNIIKFLYLSQNGPGYVKGKEGQFGKHESY